VWHGVDCTRIAVNPRFEGMEGCFGAVYYNFPHSGAIQGFFDRALKVPPEHTDLEDTTLGKQPAFAIENPQMTNIVYPKSEARKPPMLARAPSVVATVADGECKKYEGPGPAPFDYERAACWAADQPACAGKQQSPIDIRPSSLQKEDVGSEQLLIKHYPENGKALAGEASVLKVEDKVHTVQVSIPKGADGIPMSGKQAFGGDQYRMLQYHVHFPSEHAINGKLAAGEVHFVHQKVGSSGLDDLMVVGVLYQEGAKDDLLSAMGLGETKSTYPLDTPAFNIDSYLESKGVKGNFYTYDGSLTTPPCTESVRWVVMEKPLTASKAQIESFKTYFKEPNKAGGVNNRPVQEANGRILKKSVQTPRGGFTPA